MNPKDPIITGIDVNKLNAMVAEQQAAKAKATKETGEAQVAQAPSIGGAVTSSGIISQNGNTPINVDAFAKDRFVVPPPVKDTTAANKLGMSAAQATIAPPTQPARSESQITADRIKEIAGIQATQGDFTAQAQADVQLEEKTREANALQARALETRKRYEDRIKKVKENIGGMSAAQLDNAVSDLERQANEDLANIGIQQQVALGNLEVARQIVKDKVEAKFEPLKNELATRLQQYNLLQNDMSESQKLQAQQIIDMQNRKVTSLSDAAKTVLSKLAENNAPAEIYSRVEAELNNPNATPSSIFATAAGYTGKATPGSVLDARGKIVLPKDDSARLNKELVSGGAYQAINKSIDSLEYLNNFETLFNKYGSTSSKVSPFENRELKSAYNAAVLNLKEFFNLGVLNGPDLEQIQGILVNPTDRAAVNVFATKQTKDSLAVMKQNIEDTLDNRFADISAQYSDYSPESITSLRRAQESYIKAKAQLNPRVAQFISENPNLEIADVIEVIANIK